MEVPLLVNDFLRRAAKLYPDKTAIVDGDRALHLPRVPGARATSSRTRCSASASSTGDRVCILSPNSHFFLESFYGTQPDRRDPRAAQLPPGRRRPRVHHQPRRRDRRARRPRVHRRSSTRSARSLTTVRALDRRAGRRRRRPTGWTDWDALDRARSPTTAAAAGRADENDVVSINYTSGTTARPKGVMLTHRNCYINAYNLIAHLGIRHDDVELWTLPMFHCNGWGGVYALTAHGRHARRPARRRRPRRSSELIEREGVTFACMAPAVLRTILDYPDKAQARRSRTRPRFTVAGAPPPAAFIERLEKELGWEFIQIYGLTETAPILTVSHAGPPHARRTTTRGARAPASRRSASRSQVLDDDGKPVPQDGETIGEVCARSNVVLQGLLGAAGGDREGDPRRLLPHRRPRGLGRVRQHPHRRPQEGRDHLRRREHQLAGDRGRALPAPGRARVRRDRRAAARSGARRRRRSSSCAPGHDADGGGAASPSAASTSRTSSARPRSTSSRRCRARPPASCRSSCCASSTGRADAG